MAGTLLSALETRVRQKLLETTADHWTSQEVIDHLNDGIQDIRAAIIDLDEKFFFTYDATNVSLAADTSTLTGVPADVYRVDFIRPRDLSATATGRAVTFVPLSMKDHLFTAVEGWSAQDPGAGPTIYYDIYGAGPPVAAPTIRVAPQLSSALNLTMGYLSSQAALTAAGTNPLPTIYSDPALIAYAVAWLLATDNEDREPNETWMNIYKTQRDRLLTALPPRQQQEPEIVEGPYEGIMSGWGGGY